jgi:hypothetical protein
LNQDLELPQTEYNLKHSTATTILWFGKLEISRELRHAALQGSMTTTSSFTEAYWPAMCYGAPKRTSRPSIAFRQPLWGAWEGLQSRGFWYLGNDHWVSDNQCIGGGTRYKEYLHSINPSP